MISWYAFHLVFIITHTNIVSSICVTSCFIGINTIRFVTGHFHTHSFSVHCSRKIFICLFFCVKEIGLLSRLTYMRLSHNSLMGNAPTELGKLKHLEFIQLNGNRISGTIPELKVNSEGHSSFVADCGSPSDFDETLVCPNCTMCCE